MTVTVSLFIPKGTTYALVVGDPPVVANLPPAGWVTKGHDFEHPTLAAGSYRYGTGDRWAYFDLPAGVYTIAPKGWPATSNALPVPDPAVGVTKQLDVWNGPGPAPIVTLPDTPPTKPPEPPVVVPPDPTAKPFPAWRRGAMKGQLITIPGTERLSDCVPDGDAHYVVDAWNGWAASDDGRLFFAAASGHNIPLNPVVAIDLKRDAPAWQLLHPGSPRSAVTLGAYYTDGLPTSRHTYHNTQYVRAEHAKDGQERVVLLGSYATYATGREAEGAYVGGPKVDGFRVADKAWDAAGAWPDLAVFAFLPSIARDPRNGIIYYAADYTVARWDPRTGANVTFMGRPGQREAVAPNLNPPTMLVAWNTMASMVDIKRDLLVGLVDGRPYYDAGKIRLERVNLTTHAISTVAVTGDFSKLLPGGGLVHDLDADRYLHFTPTGQIYSIDPTSGASVKVLDYPAPAYSIENRVSYSAQLGGVVFLPRYDTPLHAYITR